MERLNFDLANTQLRELNQFLHHDAKATDHVTVLNPDGAHNIAVGLDCAVEVEIHGHAGYYAGGMNQLATITIHGAAGTGARPAVRSRQRRAGGAHRGHAHDRLGLQHRDRSGLGRLPVGRFAGRYRAHEPRTGVVHHARPIAILLGPQTLQGPPARCGGGVLEVFSNTGL